MRRNSETNNVFNHVTSTEVYKTELFTVNRLILILNNTFPFMSLNTIMSTTYLLNKGLIDCCIASDQREPFLLESTIENNDR